MTCSNANDCLQVLKMLYVEVASVKLVEVNDLHLQRHLLKFERSQCKEN